MQNHVSGIWLRAGTGTQVAREFPVLSQPHAAFPPQFLRLYNRGARLDVFLLEFLQPRDSLTLQVPFSQRAPSPG